MAGLMDKLKSRLNENVNAPIQSQVIEISSSAKSFVCKNHFATDNKGNVVIKRVVMSFLPNETQRTCECGIIYKRI